MESETKSLSRLIRNLESDPDIQAAIAAKIKHATAQEAGLRMLKERVARLNDQLIKGNTLPPIIAHEVALVLRAATIYCPKVLGQALAESLHEQFCLLNGYCIECGTHIQNKTPEQILCTICTNKLEAMRAEAEHEC